MSICLPDSIRTRLPYLLARAHQRQLDVLARHTAAFDIAGRDYAVMLLLEAHPRLWQSQIAEALGLDRTTVTYLVDGLEKRDWVARQRDPADRRAHVVGLTEAGEQALADIKPAVIEAKKELLAPLSDDEQDQLRDLLTRLIAEAP
ncbi:MarR family winged helix-turn-helix transcriptional regulator [Salinisphaera sp. LB1]|uniref:MarR family winged helix-turn-helix transcriptional regulator n=1 Tax=Salinisphaera sp. LB1 TaxID=2183911 RepID=UPI000D706C8C|nr:MarR family transcriptional regulator [Salinisphaera sp. LB1]AWN14882.1 Transcriptional regulator, MarR family [Salinisphaera sp. LB1]